jgi:hypothetical protein
VEVGRCGVVNGGVPKGGDACPPVKLSTASVIASNPDPAVGEECRKADLDTTVGEGTKSMDLKVARILPEAVPATWNVHRL